MRFSLVGLCILFLAVHTSAQLGTISGNVSDDFGPLAGARVSIANTDLSVSCDINGDFKFEIKPGQYEVTANYLLYKTEKKEISISFNNLHEKLNFVLASGSSVDADISVGSRVKPKSQMENVAAVDIISSSDLAASGRMTLSDALHYLVPSFHATAQTISDGTDHITPATLRGFGPDQVLVLINGKRRHVSSLVNVNGTVGKGAVSTDFDALPISAIDRIEILRDGAAAQYGSDAIAGVINIILKEQTNVFTVNSLFNPTIAGDGNEFLVSTNYGMEIGKNGYINISGELKSKEAVNRSGNYTGNIYSEDDSLDALLIESNDFFGRLDDYKAKQTMQIGSAKRFDATLFYNAVIPIKNKAEIYSNGGINYRRGESRGFYRFPYQKKKVVAALFPHGFSPEIHSDIVDQSVTIGVRGTRNGWLIDFSNSFGKNQFDLTLKNSNNASFGSAAAPISYAGGFRYKQSVTNLDFSKKIETTVIKSVNMAFGGEFRSENYQIIAGEDQSWQDGGQVNDDGEAYEVGMQLFPGIQAQNELSKTRSNVAGYADVEFHLTKKFLFEGAIRYENYSLFGDNLSWKVASRYKLSSKLSIRSSFSTGFKAPYLHQIYFNNLGTQFIDGESVKVGTFNNESATTRAFGIKGLIPETSENFSFGLTTKLWEKFTLTLDGYYITVKDRIVLSGRFAEGYEATLASVGAGSAQFFTNAINTETLGFDIVPAYAIKIKRGLFKVSGAINTYRTRVVGAIKTSALLEGAETTLFNREEIARVECAQPKSKSILMLNYTFEKWFFSLKNTRFGSVAYIHPSDANAENWTVNEFTGKAESRDQYFKPKIITDFFVSYRFNNNLLLAVGGNNIFNIYPDKLVHSVNTNNGNFLYSRRVQQFGVRGASYFLKLTISL